jgi:hypothetical protein
VDKLNKVFLAVSPHKGLGNRYLLSQISNAHRDKTNMSTSAPQLTPVGVISFVVYMHNRAHSKEAIIHHVHYIGADVCTEAVITFYGSRNFLDNDDVSLALRYHIPINDLMHNLRHKVAAHKATQHSPPKHKIVLRYSCN